MLSGNNFYVERIIEKYLNINFCVKLINKYLLNVWYV